MQKIAFLLYYFLRWIDDTIDRNHLPKNKKIRFLLRERKVIENIFAGKQLKNLNDYETGLILLRKFDKKIAIKIKRYVIDNYIKAFELELKRNEIVTKKWLSEYAYYVGGSFANFGLIITNPNLDTKIMNGISKTCATAADLTHLLRDFRKDLRTKKLNIPKEDIEKFNIEPNKLNENCRELSNFARSQVNEIYKLFSSGEKYIKSTSSFRLRLASALFISKYKFVLAKIKNRNYDLFSDYDHSTLSEKFIRMGIVLDDILRLAF
ncbi:MAG: squalene/phytoene synthase family protein [Candidatus Aenigmarchaeota archaeon]|nr:squalene/phytoene synthase family protein [Candidatus Aenigmarchaeota archaeon]